MSHNFSLAPRLSRLFAVLLALGLPACGSLPSAGDAPKTYLLETPVSAAPISRPAGKILTVNLPRSAPGYDTADIRYLRTPSVLESYALSAWADTPARMLLPLLVRSLENTGRFAAVLSVPAPPVSGALRLDTDILRLHQDFLERPSAVRLTVRAQLLDMEGRSVLATQVFDLREPAPSDDAPGGVRAANRAVAELLRKLDEFVLRAVAE